MGASASNDLAGSLEEDRRFTSDALSRVLFDDAALFKLASELKGPRVADPKESGDQSTILASCHFLAACLLLALSFLCLALRTVSDAKAHICYSEQPRVLTLLLLRTTRILPISLAMRRRPFSDKLDIFAAGVHFSFSHAHDPCHR